MATTVDFIEFVMEQLNGFVYEFRYKKMFGEYCVYANEKPILLVCDNTVYIKILPCLEPLMFRARTLEPYNGARPHYLLDIEDSELLAQVVPLLEQNTPLPKPRKPKLAKQDK